MIILAFWIKSLCTLPIVPSLSYNVHFGHRSQVLKTFRYYSINVVVREVQVQVSKVWFSKSHIFEGISPLNWFDWRLSKTKNGWLDPKYFGTSSPILLYFQCQWILMPYNVVRILATLYLNYCFVNLTTKSKWVVQSS